LHDICSRAIVIAIADANTSAPFEGFRPVVYIFALAVTALTLWRWLLTRHPIELSPKGLFDPRLGQESIPWASISEARTEYTRGAPSNVIIECRPAAVSVARR
jgi:hypothetical protein